MVPWVFIFIYIYICEFQWHTPQSHPGGGSKHGSMWKIAWKPSVLLDDCSSEPPPPSGNKKTAAPLKVSTWKPRKPWPEGWARSKNIISRFLIWNLSGLAPTWPGAEENKRDKTSQHKGAQVVLVTICISRMYSCYVYIRL